MAPPHGAVCAILNAPPVPNAKANTGAAGFDVDCEIMTIKVIKGNITSIALDAIVNSASPSLIVGGVAFYAIDKAAGPELKEARRKFE